MTRSVQRRIAAQKGEPAPDFSTDKYVSAEKHYDGWYAALNVGVQHFHIAPRFDTREEAEWMAGQLRKALRKMMKDVA